MDRTSYPYNVENTPGAVVFRLRGFVPASINTSIDLQPSCPFPSREELCNIDVDTVSVTEQEYVLRDAEVRGRLIVFVVEKEIQVGIFQFRLNHLAKNDPLEVKMKPSLQ